jgi:hypothetical protein
VKVFPGKLYELAAASEQDRSMVSAQWHGMARVRRDARDSRSSRASPACG